jgi:hypothetical protein
MSMAGVLARKGAPVTFSQTTPGVYDGTTGVWSDDVVVTVSGLAMQIEGDPETYAALGLVESLNPTLLFRPSVPGVLPALGMTIVWGGNPLTVKDVEPEAMNGIAKSARIRVSR